MCIDCILLVLRVSVHCEQMGHLVVTVINVKPFLLDKSRNIRKVVPPISNMRAWFESFEKYNGFKFRGTMFSLI